MKKELQSKFITRQHMLAEDFEIYYYSDVRHSNVEPHTHDYYEFYFYLEGDVVFELNGELRTLRPGDIIIVPPGLVHRAFVTDTNKIYRRFVFWISSAYAHDLSVRFPDFQYLLDYVGNPSAFHLFLTDMVTYNTILSRINQLIEEIHGSKFGRESMIEVRVEDLVLHLNRLVHTITAPPAVIQEKGLYEKVLDYIDLHLEEDLSLDRLSELFYVSKYYLAHNFKDRLGFSLHRYIIKKRLAACRDAILMNEKTGEVCLRYGFNDYTVFYKAFKKEYGVSPKKYRETSATARHYLDNDSK